jgi:predicted RNA-binding Zn ribbon-like protein
VQVTARAHAPGRLKLVEAFINSIERDTGRDELATPESMRRWLAQHRLASSQAELGEADRRRLVEIRQAFHELVAANGSQLPARRAVTVLNETARQIRLGIRLHPEDGYRLMSEGLGVDRVIGDLLVPALAGMADGTWLRLKICANAACGRAFYDSSRNRSGRWCSMAVCGNRIKGRAYRDRRAASASKSKAREPIAAAAS